MIQRFRYQAKNNKGEVVHGTIDADSDSHAYRQLASQGYFPMAIELVKASEEKEKKKFFKWRFKRFHSSKVSIGELANVFDHFSILLSSGFPVLKCLELIQKQLRNAVLINVFDQIIKDVQGGVKLSESISNFPTVFPPTVSGAFQAGEASGKLDSISTELSKSFESEAELRAKVTAALVYPAFVACFGIVTVFFVMTFIIPKLVVFFDSWDHPLPFPTRILLGISFLFGRGLGVALILFFGFLIWFWNRLARERKMAFLSSTTRFFPFAQSVLFLSDFVPLARTWSLLLKSGVPILESIRISQCVVSSASLKKSLRQVSDQVMQGSSLSQSLYEAKIFPELALSFLSVGEESGGLDIAFARIAQFYERELDRKLRTLTTLLEPMLILLVGLGICFIVLSLLLPIFEINMLAQ